MVAKINLRPRFSATGKDDRDALTASPRHSSHEGGWVVIKVRGRWKVFDRKGFVQLERFESRLFFRECVVDGPRIHTYILVQSVISVHHLSCF